MRITVELCVVSIDKSRSHNPQNGLRKWTEQFGELYPGRSRSFNQAAIMMTDLRIAIRKLWKSPGFAVTAIVTLALGIGANAVMFSVLNAVVLRPVKVPNAQNLYHGAALPVSIAVLSRLCGSAGPKPDI